MRMVWFRFLLVLAFAPAAGAALWIDFTHTGGPVEPGYQPYYASHESAVTFTPQGYAAFGTTVTVLPTWPGHPAAQAMQMIDRPSGSNLLRDWIGTDARVANADPLELIISGLPAGRYSWTSYHHDTQDQTGRFDVTVSDAAGSATTNGIDISNGPLTLENVTRFETAIVSDGVSPVVLSFDCQNYTSVSEAFFVMNALVLDGQDRSEEAPPTGVTSAGSSVVINEFVASNRRGLTDGDGNASDWIELYNGGAGPVSLSGWYLTDERDQPQKWPFPPTAILPARGYLVVFASGQATENYVDKQGYLHANFALAREGEYLALTGPDAAVVYEYAPAFPAQQTDVSYGLSGNTACYFAVPTPGRANGSGSAGLTSRTVHSHERGFYEGPFDLRISCDTPGAVIRYTLDGSEPTEQHGTVYDPTLPIPIVTTTCVRSVAFKAGWIRADVTTHTYIFVDEVARQGRQPPGWPDNWGYDSEVGGIVPADYEMDPRVVNSTQPGYCVRDALLDIPTVSISMLPDDFIGPAAGIWTHPLSRNERKCSLEYILPDGAEGFQCDCKIEMHGGSSRRPYRMQKHSMRLTFTSLYGPPKLRYPLFPGSGIEEFNQLVLRGGFCDSWGLISWMPDRYRPNDSQYIRDTWMKESLRDMDQPSSYGSFVHLYVNGLYFGLYNLSERLAEDFFAEHLGGRPEDWEVNADFATPGARWRAMMALDPSTFAGYTLMQEYLDVEDFADYMLLHFYADAEDWPHHNGCAAANITSGDGRFRFFVWDQEIALDYHGRAASRIDNNSGAGALFQKLRASAEFRQLFADCVYKHCFHNGALSVAASQDRYLTIANWIDKAIVAESARWGDARMSVSYGNPIQQPNPLTDINHILYPPAPHGPDYYFTREDSWVVERDNVIHNYIPAIHDPAHSYALLNVLRAENLYPDIDPPVFYVNGVEPPDGPVARGDALTLVNPNGRGTVYYTLDGTDPHLPGSAAGQEDANILVGEEAAKRVLVPTNDIGTSWTGGQPFDDTRWLSGTGGVGYERNSGYEQLFNIDVQAPMDNGNTSCYIRIPFTLAAEELPGLTDLLLRVRYDDGFVAYLNGVEVARDLFSGTPQWNSAAGGSHPDTDAATLTDFDISVSLGLLRPGDNILAVHALNASPTSSDFLLSAALVTVGRTAQSDSSVSPTARAYAGPIPLTGRTRIKARVSDRGRWSALNEMKCD
jgi:hypothetical protein